MRRMMWLVIVCLLMFCNFLMSCKPKNPVYIAENCIYDSIVIDSITDASELLNMTVLDSHTIISFNRNGNWLYYYKKKNDHFFLDSSINLAPGNFFIEACFIDNQYLFLVDRGKKENFMYYLKEKKLILLPPQAPFPHLGENYIIAASKYLPIYFINENTNSFLAGIYPKLPKYRNKYYNEKHIHNFIINNKHTEAIQHYFNKQSISQGLQISGSYKLISNKLYVLFPYSDSLYVYDLESKEYSTLSINNIEFEKSEQWDIADFTNQKKTTEYKLNNFEYILLTQDYLHTDNFLLFYQTPVEKKADANPTFDDQKLKLLVWKTNEEKKYYIFNERYYRPGCGLTYNNQFYGLSKFNKLKKNGKTVFYLFDFNNCASKL